MNSVGIICEYNPFHNGHLHHLNEVKKMFPNDTIILITSTTFTQHGDICLIDKWDKTRLSLELGIDVVIELPFNFATQSADTFAYGSINILNHLKVDKIVFGSELNDIDTLTKLAKTTLSKKYDKKVKEYLSQKINYPTALSKALNDLTDVKIDKPNDILGICYIKEILKLNSSIKPICIKRTNDYHSKSLDSTIASATSIRTALDENKNISEYVPKESLKYIKKIDLNEYFKYLKYKIISTDNLLQYVEVDDGINNRIKKYINISNNLDELINNIKTKHYTYSKIKRILVHIICDFKKNDINNDITYIRILGFNNKGKQYLNKIKKEINIPILTKYSSLLKLELKVISIYSLIIKEDLITQEYKNKPIIK